MKKEDILAMSREENKKKDPFEQEIGRTASRLGVLVASLLATLFFITDTLVNSGFNYGLYAVVFSFGTVSSAVRAIKLRQAKDIVLAIFQVALLVLLSVLHMRQLLAG